MQNTRLQTGTIIAILAITMTFLFSACEKKDRIDDGIPIFSPKPDIINPPDTFKLMFPLNNAVLTDAKISFDTTSTWLIERQNAYSARFEVSRFQDTLSPIIIEERATLVFEKDVVYEFTAKNTYPSYHSLIVLFTKRP
jgi:hypothetical protein